MNEELNICWTLWYHSINDNEWGKKSYKKIFEINNIFDMKILFSIIKKNNLQNGMFFFMKNNIFPTWEDPSNRLGGCMSFKIDSDKILDEWNKLIYYLINNKLIDDINKITGLSISPKKEFNIIKIWLANDNNNFIINEIEPYYVSKNFRYKKHELIS